jgi:hypothetical protein
MKFILPLLMIGLLAATADAQNRRDRSTRDRGTSGGSSGSSASPVIDDNVDKASYDRYKVLSEHNIFTKNRRPPSTQRSRDSGTDRPPPKPEVASVLTGCVIEDENRYAAFVENAQTGRHAESVAGESIATGKVTAIGFDFLEYESSGQNTGGDWPQLHGLGGLAGNGDGHSNHRSDDRPPGR